VRESEELLLLETVAKERVVRIQQAIKGLGSSVVIYLDWRWPFNYLYVKAARV
jgi:hypothetical protein